MIPDDIIGKRVLILVGPYSGREGTCIGLSRDGIRWAISPDGTDEILQLIFEGEFGVLIKPGRSQRN